MQWGYECDPPPTTPTPSTHTHPPPPSRHMHTNTHTPPPRVLCGAALDIKNKYQRCSRREGIQFRTTLESCCTDAGGLGLCDLQGHRSQAQRDKNIDILGGGAIALMAVSYHSQAKETPTPLSLDAGLTSRRCGPGQALIKP